MQVLRHHIWLFLAILAGMISPAASAGPDGPADRAEKAVTEFCLPVLAGGDAAATAEKLGIEQRYRVAPHLLDWATRNGGGTYYRYPTASGKLLIVVKAVKTQLACDVALFDVAPAEGERAFGQIDAIFQARHYRRVKGMPENGVKAYKGDRTLIILVGPRSGAGESDPQMHVTMKRRLYVF